MSWLFIALHLWLAMYREHRLIFFQSKREDDSKSMIDRAWAIYQNLPEWIRARHRATRSATKIQFANGSVIWGIPQGEDIVRQYTCSAIFSDEIGFQEFADKAWAAAMPTLTGGGRFTAVTTANPGFFCDSVRGAKSTGKHEIIRPGLEFWKNAADEVSVLRVHYTADDDPKTRQKVEQARRSYEQTGRQAYFLKEYEIDYGALSGQLIFPELDRDLHQINPFPIPESWPRFRAIDPGWRNPCAVLWITQAPLGWRDCREGDALISPLIAYREFYQAQWTVSALAKVIKSLSGSERYQATLIDPSADIHKGNESAQRSTFEQFNEEGLGCIPANNVVDAGLDDVRRRLQVYGKSPALLFFSNLNHVWAELTAYRYQEHSAKVLEHANPAEKPIKKNDHLVDVCRYLCCHSPLRLPLYSKQAILPQRSFGATLTRQDEMRHQRGLLGNVLAGRGQFR